MGMPIVVAVGALSAGTGDVTPDNPAHIANDIRMLFAECERTAADDNTVVLGTPNGFAATADSPQVVNVAGGVKLFAFWKRAAGPGEPAPVIADPGDHVESGMVVIRGVKTVGDPWNVTSGGSDADFDTALSVPGDITTVINCLVLAAVASHWHSVRHSAWANSDLANITEHFDNGTNQGAEGSGAIAIVTGEKASAGAYGATTATASENADQAYMTIALEGASGGGGGGASGRSLTMLGVG